MRSDSAHAASRIPRAAFTLIEMLLAMFILSLGLVSVASIFPVATYLQRSSLEEAMALQAVRSAQAMIDARGIRRAVLNGKTKEQVAEIATELTANWPISTRCYPSTLDLDDDGVYDEDADADLSDGNQGDDGFLQRDFYWVPLVMASDRGHKVFLFILRKRPGEQYEHTPLTGGSAANAADGVEIPSVLSTAAAPGSTERIIRTGVEVKALNVGDPILDNLGNIHQIVVKDGRDLTVSSKVPSSGVTTIWYSPQPAVGTSGSPCRRIVVIGEEAFE